MYFLSTWLTCYSQEKQAKNLGIMDAKALEGLLKRNNFAPDFIAADFGDARYQQLSVVFATATVSLENRTKSHEFTILEASNPSRTAQSLANRLIFELENSNCSTRRLKWDTDVSELKGKTCVSLIELETPFLLALDIEGFSAMKHTILQCESLLWVTAIDNPAEGLAIGMARSIRNEIPGIQFRTLSAQAKSLELPEQLAPLVGKLAMTSTSDDEFVESNGLLENCRVVEDGPMNEEMLRWLTEGKDRIDLIPLEQVDGAQKLAIKAQGMLDTLCLEADEHAMSEIGADEIEIEVKATGLK